MKEWLGYLRGDNDKKIGLLKCKERWIIGISIYMMPRQDSKMVCSWLNLMKSKWNK